MITEKYFLRLDYIDAIKKNPKYLYLNNSIAENRGMNILNKQKEVCAKFFVPELAYLLTCSEVPYMKKGSNETEYFDGSKFFGYYTEAYTKGEHDFDKDFGIDANTLYGVNAPQYVRAIHYNYFHADIKNNDCEGWNHWRKSFPFSITKEVIAEYGYYSGFIGKVWALADKHPQLFKDLEKCELKEHEKKEQKQADTSKAEKEKRNYIPLAFSYYYKQSVQEIEWFDNWQGGRENAYKKVVSQHYTNPAKTAWKQFQREYVKIENEHSNNRWQLCSKENYPAILELLKDNPKGLAKAKEELSKAVT